MRGKAAFDGIAAEELSRAGRQERISRPSRALGEPDPQDRDGPCGQRRDPLFASFAAAADMGAGAEVDIRAAEPDQLRDPQSALECEQEQGMVAPAGPGRAVGGREQSPDLRFAKEGDEVAFEPLGRDGEDTFDQRGVLGMAKGGIAEQRVDRGEPGVARAHAVAALTLEVVEERADERGVEIGDVELAGLLSRLLRGERQQ